MENFDGDVVRNAIAVASLEGIHGSKGCCLGGFYAAEDTENWATGSLVFNDAEEGREDIDKPKIAGDARMGN